MSAFGVWPFAILALVGLGLVVWGASELHRLIAGRRYGQLESVDVRGSGRRWESERYRLVGRPDELRRRADGRPVPVEWKSRSAPPAGPPSSHRLQVLAYCLLLEDVTGFSPPYGVLRYADGVEVRVLWDARA